MTLRRPRSRRGRLTGGHLDGREIRVTRCMGAMAPAPSPGVPEPSASGAILVEHWPRDGHRDAVVLSTLADEELLTVWLEAHGASVAWQ